MIGLIWSCVSEKLVRRTLTAAGTWSDCIRVLKRRHWGHPIRLLQPGVTMATVSLLHRGERFLLVDTPKTHRAEAVRGRDRNMWVHRQDKIVGLKLWRVKKLPSVSPVVSSCYHVLLINKLDTVDGTSVWRHNKDRMSVVLMDITHNRCPFFLQSNNKMANQVYRT